MLKLGGIAHRTEERIHTASRVLNWVAIVALILLALAVFVDVAARTINRPVPGNIDVAELLLILLAFCAMAHTHLLRGHVRVEIVYSRLSTRIKGILDSITLFLAAGVYGFVVWAMADRVWRIITSPGPGPVTFRLEILIFPFLIVIVVGLLVLCLELLVNFSHAVARASGR